MRLFRRRRVRVIVTERTGDTPGRQTILSAGDTMAIGHRVTITEGRGTFDRHFDVADIRVEKGD